MKIISIKIFLLVALPFITNDVVFAKEKIHYTGSTLSNPTYHDGQLSPIVGVHNIQVMRVNREHPDASNCNGWTYNHQPMMAYWNGKFYLQFLSDEVSEHIPPSQTFLQTSTDGYSWTNPQVLFPIYKVPDGFTKPDISDVANNLTAIMHQRVGFYVSKSNRLITMAFYGVALNSKDGPNDGNGIGRVVREIKKDGSYGPIYFIHYNHGFNAKNTDYPNFTKSKDKDFVKSCQEILDNPLYMMQWVEESDRGDKIIPFNRELQAFNYYHLPDGNIACLWKHALTSISTDGGKTWDENVQRAQGFVNSNAKIWGQHLTDGSYATVYNPSEFRWPLAISTSADGLNYTTLNLVHGEISSMRYGGNYKSYGPQYVRGIQEGNGIPPDKNMWVAYSVNKEDIWVSKIPVPIKINPTSQADDNFEKYNNISELADWNIYSPLWAPVSLEKVNGKNWLTLKDKDPFSFAKVVRKIPATKELKVSFNLIADQTKNGIFRIEFMDNKGIVCSRLELTDEGIFRAKVGYRFSNIMKYESGKNYQVEAILSTTNRNITIFVDGKQVGLRMFFAPVSSIERIAFSTGETNEFPTAETPTDQNYDLPNAGEQDSLAVFKIANFKTESLDANASASILKFVDFKHYVDYFNTMEDENIVQAIPNSQASEWMEQNIPLFECPQKNFEEMFYFRWWTLRKHIEKTPVGYAFTEFLVNRTYADKYNLISCALGHHMYESRWLRDTTYMNQDIKTWYRGNEGVPMKKMMNFSSWNIDAQLNRYFVTSDKTFLLEMLNDMEAEYARWENSHRLRNGLYWQGDVQDGTEETISGGRHKQYARPTINSYMYGNAKALSIIEKLAGNDEKSKIYSLKADTLKNLVETKLWSGKQGFFETMRKDTLANVREFIGYLPWYFNMPSCSKYDNAWTELANEKGFSAPYGMTTAEQRHPEFRTRGVGKCEWDGAIWPFATSQVLTAMANFMNNYPQKVTNDSIYFSQLEKLVQSQSHRGLPYVGEYLDETTGYWLKGDQERSRYYNHSTFNDLIITGLIGLRPRMDNTIEVNPLLPEGKWDWFCLDNILYHGHNLTIVWDKNGNKYHVGKGLQVLVDGTVVGKSDKLTKILCPLNSPKVDL
ncbi:MAG: trehalase family glycosidase [Paludibacter sp.]|nr:trehalase family glycosidase [Paludibacter sp.]